jgi:hypothetical protein
MTTFSQGGETKVRGMENALEKKAMMSKHAGKHKKAGVMDQALAQLESMGLEEQHESWWSIVLFWIHELRWRRIFWEKMGRPPGKEIEQ